MDWPGTGNMLFNGRGGGGKNAIPFNLICFRWQIVCLWVSKFETLCAGSTHHFTPLVQKNNISRRYMIQKLGRKHKPGRSSGQTYFMMAMMVKMAMMVMMAMMVTIHDGNNGPDHDKDDGDEARSHLGHNGAPYPALPRPTPFA